MDPEDPMTKRRWQYLLGGAILLLLILQLVPSPPADNPPVEEELVTPPEVAGVLRQSCYDCHSSETEWPWYADVAPMKWLVRDHVAEARDEMNFSAWNRIDVDARPHKFEEIAEEVEEEHMPLRSYLILHRDARLTDADRKLLVGWATARAAEGEGAEEGAEEVAEPAEDPDR